MTTRGAVILSALLGMFAFAIAAFAVRALDVGPDAPRPSAAAIAMRTKAADRLERRIARLRANVPPALPAAPTAPVATMQVTQRVYAVPVTSGGASGTHGDDNEHGDGGEGNDA